MEFLKKLDLKSIVILILGLALIISFIFGQHNNIDYNKDEIDNLHKKNVIITKMNDSLIKVNAVIDSQIHDINKKLAETTIQLDSIKKELQILKKKNNEIPKYVSSLSANGVANAFTNYLKTKSTNPR